MGGENSTTTTGDYWKTTDTKRGDDYLSTLLIQGAKAAVMSAHRCQPIHRRRALEDALTGQTGSR
jgi:hypothetical protein